MDKSSTQYKTLAESDSYKAGNGPKGPFLCPLYRGNVSRYMRIVKTRSLSAEKRLVFAVEVGKHRERGGPS